MIALESLIVGLIVAAAFAAAWKCYVKGAKKSCGPSCGSCNACGGTPSPLEGKKVIPLRVVD